MDPSRTARRAARVFRRRGSTSTPPIRPAASTATSSSPAGGTPSASPRLRVLSSTDEPFPPHPAPVSSLPSQNPSSLPATAASVAAAAAAASAASSTTVTPMPTSPTPSSPENDPLVATITSLLHAPPTPPPNHAHLAAPELNEMPPLELASPDPSPSDPLSPARPSPAGRASEPRLGAQNAHTPAAADSGSVDFAMASPAARARAKQRRRRASTGVTHGLRKQRDTPPPLALGRRAAVVVLDDGAAEAGGEFVAGGSGSGGGGGGRDSAGRRRRRSHDGKPQGATRDGDMVEYDGAGAGLAVGVETDLLAAELAASPRVRSPRIHSGVVRDSRRFVSVPQTLERSPEEVYVASTDTGERVARALEVLAGAASGTLVLPSRSSQPSPHIVFDPARHRRLTDESVVSEEDPGGRVVGSAGAAASTDFLASPRGSSPGGAADGPLSPRSQRKGMHEQPIAMPLPPTQPISSPSQSPLMSEHSLRSSSARGTSSTPASGASPVHLNDECIPLIVECLHQHRTDPRVADRALTMLRRLTPRASARALIGECYGIEAVVDVMRIHSLRVRIQTQGCLVLANLTYRCPPNKDRVLHARGYQAVVAAMSLHDVEHIQAWGSLALRNFSNSRVNTAQDASLVAGAVDVLVAALENYPNSHVVQNQAPVGLGNIAVTSGAGMARIREQGGIQAAIAACQRNMGHALLVDADMACIRALVDDEYNQKLFGRCGGLEVITEAMKLHRGHLGINLKGCHAFRYLSFQRDNRERLGACGGVSAIVAALVDTGQSAGEDTTEQILKALSNATYDSLVNKTLAGRVGGVVATLALISADPYCNSPRVVEDCCRVLRNLADGVLSNHALIIRNRGIAIVLDVVRSHGSVSAGVAEHGIALFVNLATNKAIVGQLRGGSGDLVTVARRMSVAHSSSPRVLRQVEILLHLLEGQGPRPGGRPLTPVLIGRAPHDGRRSRDGPVMRRVSSGTVQGVPSWRGFSSGGGSGTTPSASPSPRKGLSALRTSMDGAVDEDPSRSAGSRPGRNRRRFSDTVTRRMLRFSSGP